ncbi:MAG: carboxypeptidase regulatory-like domain-containing protein [Ferruginibacter sp.]
MKKIITMLIGVCIAVCVQAQDKAGSITGNITNAESKPTEAATVQLLKAVDKTLVKVTVTDKAGNFLFEKLATGKYIISISAVGFAKKITEPVTITSTNLKIDAGNIQLLPQTKGLSEVVVVSSRPLIEQKPDRTIVNVEASPSNAGATALEVLEKSPGVTVDNDGNISL